MFGDHSKRPRRKVFHRGQRRSDRRPVAGLPPPDIAPGGQDMQLGHCHCESAFQLAKNAVIEQRDLHDLPWHPPRGCIN